MGNSDLHLLNGWCEFTLSHVVWLGPGRGIWYGIHCCSQSFPLLRPDLLTPTPAATLPLFHYTSSPRSTCCSPTPALPSKELTMSSACCFLQVLGVATGTKCFIACLQDTTLIKFVLHQHRREIELCHRYLSYMASCAVLWVRCMITANVWLCESTLRAQS